MSINNAIRQWRCALLFLIITVSLPAVAQRDVLADGVLRAAQADGAIPVIVTLKQDRQARASGWQNLSRYIEAQQDRALEDGGWRNLNEVIRFKRTPAMALKANAKQLKRLSRSPAVSRIFRNEMRTTSLAESTQVVEATTVWPSGFTGKGHVVAVLDTGVDGSHPFLRDKLVAEACFSTTGELSGYKVKSLCPNGQMMQTGAGAAAPCLDECSHGTHVAGIVAGSGSEFSGVAPEAKLMAAQVFSRVDGMGVVALDSDIMLALEWVFDHRDQYNIAAVNMSLGGGRFFSHCDNENPQTDLIELLHSVGIATVIASGNDYFMDAISGPACIDRAISVGATNGNAAVAPFSNSADMIDLLAPGTNAQPSAQGEGIESSIPRGRFARYPGTSMATPHVAGALAVLRSAAPSASVDELVEVLASTGLPVRDARNGLVKPRIAVGKAVEALGVASGVASDEPAPEPEKPKRRRVNGILIIDDRDG